jgi:ketosteroid isomerase-like protein
MRTSLVEASREVDRKAARLADVEQQLAASVNANELLEQKNEELSRRARELEQGYSVEKERLEGHMSSMRTSLLEASSELDRLRSEQTGFERENMARLKGELDMLQQQVAEQGAQLVELEEQKNLEQIKATLQSWLKVWSQRDIEGYLEHYADAYEPPEGSRADWERQKRRTFRNARSIRVDITDVNIALNGDDAIASFEQDYRSSLYRDRIRKTLKLVAQDGGWKIIDEQTDS